MFWSTKASISCSTLSVVVTCELADLASSPTYLYSIGGGLKPGEHGLEILRPTVPKHPGAGAASPGAALLRTSMPVSRFTKSCSKPLAPSPSWGPAPDTSMQEAPCDRPSAPSVTRTRASHASDVGSSDMGVPPWLGHPHLQHTTPPRAGMGMWSGAPQTDE
jgi:hypothetical protein